MWSIKVRMLLLGLGLVRVMLTLTNSRLFLIRWSCTSDDLLSYKQHVVH